MWCFLCSLDLNKENKVLFSNQTLPHLTEFLNGKNVQRLKTPTSR